MAGNATEIKICSNALLLLGHDPIADFDEPTVGAQVSKNFYESSYKNLLVQYRWRFATKKVQLARLADTPLNDFQYAYQLPSNLLYMIKPRYSRDWEIYQDKLYTNVPQEEIDYIYDVEAGYFPHYFIKTLEFFLAMQFAIPITGSTEKSQVYNSQYEAQLARAKYADSSQRPSDRIEHNPYVDIRN